MRVYEFVRLVEAFPIGLESLLPAVVGDAPSKKAATRAAKSPSAASPLPSSATAEQLLASIGLGNWHGPMLRAVAKLVAQGCSDAEILAKTASYTLPGWTAEQTYAEVSGMIAGARRKGFDVKSKPRSGPLKLDVPPAYSTQSLSAAEATTRLDSTTEGWFGSSAAFAQTRRELKGLRHSLYGPVFVSRVRAELVRAGILPAPMEEVEALTDRHTRRIRAREWKKLKEKLLKDRGLFSLSRGPRLAIQAAAGLGKTAAFVRYIMKHPETWGLNIWIFVPSLDLAEHLAASFGPGPYVRVIKGRLAKTDGGREKGEGTMCLKPKAAAAAGPLGINIYKAICKRGENLCQFYDRCPWISQWSDTTPGVRIFTHEYLFLHKLSPLPKPDLVIVDESFVETAVGRMDFLPDRLVQPAPWKSEAVSACLESLRAALEGDKPLLAALREAGLSRREFAAALGAAEAGLKEEIGVIPAMGEEESVKHLSALEESELVKVARVLRQIVAEFDLPRDLCHSVFLRRNKPVRVNGVIERQNRIVVAFRRDPVLQHHVPILATDADADKEIGRLIFGDDLDHVHIPVERRAEVIQCFSSTFSRQSLLGFSGASERALAWAEKRFAAVKRFIHEKAAELSTLAITNLPVRRKFTGEDEKKVELAFEWGPAVISHFGRIRGIDLWKGRQIVIVIGREQPPPEEIETLARGLYWDDPEPLKLTGTYAKALRGYRLKDGRQVGVEVDVHLDPRAQRILELKRERELAQAIDRVRLVHCETPKVVLILCNLPLDIDVDRLVSWRDLVNGGCRLDQALKRNGWALPLVPSCLARNWPDLFSSPRAAEHEIARKLLDNPDRVPGNSDLPKSQQDIYWLLGRSQFRPAAQNNGGHRRWSEALLAADTPYFRARVRDAMGCELVWEKPPTCRVFFKPNKNGGVL
ncbi:MAG TPA: hypothetical protein DCZ01_11335 [Elusimicrobia bacterium]|nr:MAG: hypothetical protein A2040_13130 [Rhodocyclales bacterium GWA2_65_19]HAZ09085.1 hypothetical protein [Elusimicrobiota bacterium]